ncbi:MAG: glycosyltransferase, partial [Planctomycetota bacterium]
GGTRIKIYEAMAMNKPVVSSTIGAEGLKVTHDTDILLADTVEACAAAVRRLLENPEERHRIGKAAGQLVRENFTAEQVARQFEAVCQKTIA